MKALVVASLALAASASPARAEDRPDVNLPFTIATDGLCFLNKTGEFADTGIPVLSRLADRKGACQGMVEIAAAFRENAVFDPSKPVADDDARATLRRVVRAHKRGKDRVIEIPGYASLQAYCQAHREDFLRAAVLQNTDIAVHEIKDVLYSFYTRRDKPLATERRRGRRDKPLATERRRGRLDRALDSIHARLSSGHYPLLMVYSHVVLVTGYREESPPRGFRQIVLTIYDPNHATPREWRIELDPEDGKPEIQNHLYWDVTPWR